MKVVSMIQCHAIDNMSSLKIDRWYVLYRTIDIETKR